jgi:hypothetical protein
MATICFPEARIGFVLETRQLENPLFSHSPLRRTYPTALYCPAMRIVVCAVVALVLSSSGLVGAENKGKPACKVDSDCALVPTDCCDCNNGGKQKAILARDRASYERSRQGRCTDTLCPAVVSQDPSCAAMAAVCKEGRCSLALSR